MLIYEKLKQSFKYAQADEQGKKCSDLVIFNATVTDFWEIFNTEVDIVALV